MHRLFLLYAALIAYGSLYPFDFHPYYYRFPPLWLLFHSWPPSVDRWVVRDILVNVLLYAPVGILGLLTFPRRRRWIGAAVTMVFGAALSGAIEIAQLCVRGRTCSTLDFLCNAAGVGLGIVAGAGMRHSPLRAAAGITRLRLSAPVALLGVWAAYQTFPLFPHLGRTRLYAGLRHLLDPGNFSWGALYLNLAEWLAVCALVEALAGARRTRVLAPLLWALPLLRLLVVGRSLNSAEAAAALLGWAAWNWGLACSDRRRVWAGALLLGAVLVRGLTPWSWSGETAPFSWMPFRGVLELENFIGVVLMLRKAFDYGVAVWLLARPGASLLPATAGVAGLLALVEVLQLHLTGHVAEITDPLLAMLMALVLRLTAPKRANAAGRARKQ